MAKRRNNVLVAKAKKRPRQDEAAGEVAQADVPPEAQAVDSEVQVEAQAEELQEWDPDDPMVENKAAVWAALATANETRVAIIQGRAVEEHQVQQELLKMANIEAEQRELQRRFDEAQPHVCARAALAAAKTAAAVATEAASAAKQRACRKEAAASWASHAGKKRALRLAHEAEEARAEATEAQVARDAAFAAFCSISRMGGMSNSSSTGPVPPSYPPPPWPGGAGSRGSRG